MSEQPAAKRMELVEAPTVISSLSHAQARLIVDGAFAAARAADLKPIGVAVLDNGGHLVTFEREDGCSFLRFEIARGKANGALGLGVGSRGIAERAEVAPWFVQAAVAASGGSMIPVPGGVLVANDAGEVIGAVGISGDLSDEDEAAAVAGIWAALLRPWVGA